VVVVKRALLLSALAACGESGTEIAPVIDLPAAGSEADPRETVDELELSIARAGADAALVQRTFVRGEGLGLDGVPIDDDLVVHLIGRASGGEVAYGRTCRFDVVEDAPAAAPHLWFSRTVQWAAAPAPAEARVGGGAWTTAGQGVAVALGTADGVPVTAVEQFDPLTASWTPVADVSRRAGGVVVGLGDGRGVLLGGRTELGEPHTVVEVIDPFAPPDERVFVHVDPRLGLDGTAAAARASGDAIVIGGATDAGPVDTVFALDVGADRVLEPPRQLAARLARARRDHTLTRLSDDVGAPLVVIGGTGADGFPVVDAELYRPLREDFSPGFAKAMIVPRHHHAATRLPDGSVLVVGGLDVNGAPVATIELFTIDGGFVDAGALPPDAGLVDVALTPLPDGRVLLSGGRTDVDAPPVDTSYVIRLDPLDGTVDVTGTDDLDLPLASHAAAQLCDGTILTIGGAGDASAERYQPPSISRR
jgi:hypothetical protein